MKAILIYAKDSTFALKMQKNVQNSEIDSVTKIVAVILFVYFNKSRMRRIMIRKTTKVVTTVIKINILLRIVLNLNKRIFKLTLWKAFDRTITKTNKKHFFRDLSLKFRIIRKIKWVRDDYRRDRESQTKISKHIRWIAYLSKE